MSVGEWEPFNAEINRRWKWIFSEDQANNP